MSVLARWTDPAAAPGRPGRRERGHLGPARAAAAGAGRPRRACGTNHVTLDQIIGPPATPSSVSPLTFLEASTPGTGGFIDTPNQRLASSTSCPSSRARAISARSRSRAAPRKLRSAMSRRRRGPPAAHRRRRRHRSGARRACMLVVEKLPGANTLDVTRGVEDALDELRPGLAGRDDRHERLPAGELHRDGARPPPARGHHRPPCSCALVLAAFLLQWRAVVIASSRSRSRS